MSAAQITALGTYGTSPAPGPGVAPVAGPVVTLSFTLPLAGPAPGDLPLDPPQTCQAETPNVALQATVVDQSGAAVDLSAADALLLWLWAPDGTLRPVPAAFVSNGRDGLIEYITAPTDLNEAGQWEIQAQVTFGTQTLRTRLASFQVESNAGGL